MLRPTSLKALVSLSIAGLAMAMLQAFSQAHAATANMDISTVPLDVAAAAKPNIIFGLDDSGSMDFEVLLQTNDGAAPGSNKAGSATYNNPPTVYYRITVRVTGPKSAAAFVQALVLK